MLRGFQRRLLHLASGRPFSRFLPLEPLGCIHLHVQPVYYCEDQKEKKKKAQVTHLFIQSSVGGNLERDDQREICSQYWNWAGWAGVNSQEANE